MAIAFEIKGPMALYRKPYTTTSTISYPIPTPTAIAGLIAAVIGIPNGSDEKSASAKYWDEFSGTRIAIQRLNRTSWFSTSVNFWNTKNPQKSPHIQIKHQFIRDPHFRIWVDGGLTARLLKNLAAGKYYFIPTLGTAYAIAESIFLGEFEPVRPLSKDNIEVRSALPLSQQAENAIDFMATHGLMKDTFPFRMTVDRRIQETITLLYPASPHQGIILKPWDDLDYFDYNDEKIVWLPTW